MISIPKEDRQPSHITPQIDPRHRLPNKPRVLATDLRASKKPLAFAKKALSLLFKAIGLLILIAVAVSYPDLRIMIGGAVIAWFLIEGIRESIRRGVQQGLSERPL